MLPVAGAFSGITGSSVLVGLLFALRLLTGSAASLSILAHFLPGLFAAYYWASNSFLMRVCVPAACAVMFAAHPVGYEALIYSIFWLIPMAVYFSNNKSLFATALGSTFTAHAIGSVIWLYTVPMISEQWINLMPLVVFERCVMALGMVAVYRATNWIFARRPYKSVLPAHS